MTLLATKLPPAAFPERVVAAWNSFAVPWDPLLVTVAALTLAACAMVFHGNAAADTNLISIAGLPIAGPAGTVIARLPAAMSVVLAAMLIYRLLRQLAASAPAALFGVALLLACPLTMRAAASVSAELPQAALLFFAFCLWWNGRQQKSLATARGLAIAAALLVAFLLEGPRPTNPTFFAAGAISALIRILGDALPAVAAAVTYLLARGYDDGDTSGADPVRPGFVAAIACYAVASAVFVLLWPGGMGRYYVPAVLGLCVLGGLGYDLLGPRRPLLLAPLLLLTAGFLAYALLFALGLAT